MIMDFSNVQSVNRVAMGSGGTSFTLFGANTFDQVAQIPGINAMRTLLSWILWIGLVSMMMRDIIRFVNKT